MSDLRNIYVYSLPKILVICNKPDYFVKEACCFLRVIYKAKV